MGTGLPGQAAVTSTLLAGAAASGVAAPAAAQTAGQERVDSVELRLRQRLRALGRAPGVLPDSVRMDSLRVDSIRRVTEQRQGRGVSRAAGDSTLSMLMDSLVSYDVTSYEARRAEYHADREELFLYGDSTSRAALLQATGDQVTADSLIRYDQRREEAEALGAPAWAPANGDPVDADRLVFDTRTRAGAAYGARTDYSQGGGTVWRVTGDLPLVTGEVQYGDHARFTSCELEEPHYHFETEELKIVRGGMLVARPVTLHFADVPVAWLPFVFQSTSQGRSSGILAPRFSVNDIVRTSGDYQRRVSNVGFYWAINDYMDATVALDWFSDNYTAVTGNLRYSWRKQFLNGSLSAKRFWRSSGRQELSFDTQQRWEMSERTSFNMSAQYATSTSFIRENSFDPREVTSQVRSQGGLSHRFDWGTLNVSADRSQSLSDDKVDMSLPRVGLSLRPVTLFEAPPSDASWFNNVTWNGSANFARRISDRPDPEDGFSFSDADLANMTGSASSSFTLGRFSVSQSMDLEQGVLRDVPAYALNDPDLPLIVDPIVGVDPTVQGEETVLARAPLSLGLGGPRDLGTTDLNWTTSINYQQPLIGTTTLTPSLSLRGSMRKADTIPVAQEFVSSPTRVSAGASLKADFYGFYGGLGGFEAFRHKFSPSFSYSWSPEVQPTALQERVFGSRSLQRQSSLGITLNQTWEGKRRPPEDTTGAAVDTAGAAGVTVETVTPARGSDDGPRRIERGEIVNILSIRTSAVTYDFVRADEEGTFISGFQTTTLSNTISSDFLPGGITINMTHDLFEEAPAGEDGEGEVGGRTFSPHLSRLNFGFGLDPNSTILRWLPFGGGGDGSARPEPRRTAEDPALADPFGGSITDEASIIPGRSDDRAVRESRRAGGTRGLGWRADFNYALSRPRVGGDAVSQILNVNASLTPTLGWEMSWSTAYDIERVQFNDHRIRLTRDLHRWQAHFDFLKTATGNWTFRFEVSLLDNQDLHFDYEQRSGVSDLRPSRFR